MKKIAWLVLVALIAFMALSACGKKEEPDITGEYIVENVIVDDKTMTLSELKQELEAGSEDLEDLEELLNGYLDMLVYLKEDHKFSMKIAGITVEGTYALEGETLTMTANGSPVPCVYKDGKITMEQYNTKVILKR